MISQHCFAQCGVHRMKGVQTIGVAASGHRLKNRLSASGCVGNQQIIKGKRAHGLPTAVPTWQECPTVCTQFHSPSDSSSSPSFNMTKVEIVPALPLGQGDPLPSPEAPLKSHTRPYSPCPRPRNLLRERDKQAGPSAHRHHRTALELRLEGMQG